MVKSISKWLSSLLIIFFSQLGLSPVVFAAKLQNPLKSENLIDFLGSILGIMLTFAVPIIVFFIIYAGFQHVVAQGNEEKIKKAHNMLLWAIVGGLIILGANVIFAVIQGTIDGFVPS